jgi:hypothetical protein
MITLIAILSSITAVLGGLLGWGAARRSKPTGHPTPETARVTVETAAAVETARAETAAAEIRSAPPDDLRARVEALRERGRRRK